MARRNQHHGGHPSYQNAPIHYDAPDTHEGGPIARYAFLSVLFPLSVFYYDLKSLHTMCAHARANEHKWLTQTSFGGALLSIRWWREQTAPQNLPGNISILFGTTFFATSIFVTRVWGHLLVPA